MGAVVSSAPSQRSILRHESSWSCCCWSSSLAVLSEFGRDACQQDAHRRESLLAIYHAKGAYDARRPRFLES